jgi:hypothetical protein
MPGQAVPGPPITILSQTPRLGPARHRSRFSPTACGLPPLGAIIVSLPGGADALSFHASKALPVRQCHSAVAVEKTAQTPLQHPTNRATLLAAAVVRCGCPAWACSSRNEGRRLMRSVSRCLQRTYPAWIRYKVTYRIGNGGVS